jgi:hypothetical protein
MATRKDDKELDEQLIEGQKAVVETWEFLATHGWTQEEREAQETLEQMREEKGK